MDALDYEHLLNFYLKWGQEKSPRLSKIWATGSRRASQPEDTKCLGNRTPETGAGIVSFRKPGMEAGEIVRKLRAAGIVTAPQERLGTDLAALLHQSGGYRPHAGRVAVALKRL